MDRIGDGTISITRIFLSNEWEKSQITENQYRPKWNAPIPSDSMLVITGFFGLAREIFKILSFELMTNFVTADFAGRLTMGFAEVNEMFDGGSISFTFNAPFYPTIWTPEAVVKLHYLEIKTGRKYTSYFKCKLSEVRRGADGTYGKQKICSFDIKNPNALTYHSSGQASLEGTAQVASIPTMQRFQDSTFKQGTTQGNPPAPTKTCPNCRTENAVEYNFCMTCGYSFSQPSAPQNVQQPASQNAQQPAPQVIYVETPSPQAPQIYFEPYEGSEKPGCLAKLRKVVLTIVIIGIVLFIILFLIATFG